MRRILPLFFHCLLLAACVDTTGLSESSTRPPRGNPQGAVVVAEFADLQCPACRAAHEQLNTALLAKYGSEVRFDFIHFPLRSLHRFAQDLAEAAECSADQGKFWEFVDLAFERQEQVSRNAIRDWAGELDLDRDLFDRCMRSHIKKKTISEDVSEGQSAGVTGTPTYFVNGRKVGSTLEALTAAVEEASKQVRKRL